MSQGIESRLSTHGGLTVTVNTAVDEVAAAVAGTPELSVNGTVMNLAYGDNCHIKGFALCFPFQFGQGAIDVGGDSPMFVQLGWVDDNAHSGSVTEVGDTGLINIPDPNYWYDMDIFVPMPAAVDSKWNFRIDGFGANVSMLNVPDDLDTDVLDLAFHLKIVHTLPLLG